MAIDRKPSNGLALLEQLYNTHPNHQGVKNSLINAYIRFGYHDKALNIINQIPNSKNDIQSLKFKAWQSYKNANIPKEKYFWNKILDSTYILPAQNRFKNVFLRSHDNIRIESEDIPLISVVYNEMIRLPFFLEHYRKLGIKKFIFIDNNSDDGTLEFLLDQTDCYVFWTNDSYSEAGSGMNWVHHLIDRYISINQWCIHADADELLIYPYCEAFDIYTLKKYLDLKEFDCMSAYTLDMFPKNKKSQLSIKSGDNLIQKSPFFYNNYKNFYQLEAPYIYPIGGIFSLFNMPFRLTKTSLFKKTNDDFRFLSATHTSTPMKVSDISSTYLHFKMLGNFYEKCLKEAIRKEHWAGGVLYSGYARMCKVFENIDTLDKVVKYQDSQQLINLGLIKSSDSWLKFIQMDTENDR